MSIEVIQWATGGIGRAAIEGIRAHPDLELVGVWVHSADKVGCDVADIVGGAPTGITATDDVDALLSLGADCVLYAPVMADGAMVERIVASGANLVTPLNWFYRGERDWARVEAVSQEAGVTVHGTGIHPGGVTERLPLVASAFSASITHVRAEEWSDIRAYGAPQVIKDFMLFGTTPEEAANSIMGAVLGDGFTQSIDMIADALGIGLDDEKVTIHETSTSAAPVDSPIGVIEPGLVTAQRFTWQGTVDATPVIEAKTNWFMGSDGFEKGWEFGPEGERFEVEVTGDPTTKMTLHGWHPASVEAGLERNPGIVATANHCVSAIPAVVGAPPGIRSYLDLPFVTGRAAAELLR